MADAQSDAEKIRLRRLAKLGGGAATGGSITSSQTPSTSQAGGNAPTTEPVPPESASETTAESIVADSKTKPIEQVQNPFAQIIQPKTQPAGSTIRIHSSTPQNQATASLSRSRQAVDVPLDVWIDRTLRAIFKLTLDPLHQTDPQGHKLAYIEEVRKDLEEEGKPIQLSTDELDSALFAAGKTPPEGSICCYFLSCWKRLQRQIRQLGRLGSSDPKLQALRTAEYTCMSHCVWAATEPSMYELPEHTRNPLADAMLSDPDCDVGIDYEFYTMAAKRFEEDDDGPGLALVSAIEQISKDLSTMALNQGTEKHVDALQYFARMPKLIEALTQSPLFMPDGLAPEKIEIETLLGPFFALSPLQGEVAVSYFAGTLEASGAQVRNSQNAVQMTLKAHQTKLFDVTNCIIKAGKVPREKLLDWFALVVNKNHKRRAIQVDENTVASDGFMVNVTTILDRLCEPFMDTSYSKIDRIDVNYFRRSPRVDISDETKINADQKTSEAFWSQQAEGENNFISEVFFLAVASHHYGPEAANAKLAQVKREIKFIEGQLKELEKHRQQYSDTPARRLVFDAHYNKFKTRLERAKCIVKAIQGVLQDKEAQQRSLQLMRYVIVWIMRMVDPKSQYPRSEVTLPLAEAQPDVFRCLPEYFVEGVVDNFKFVTMHVPEIMAGDSTQLKDLLTMCITFLRSSEYVKNPGVKSGLIQILFYGVLPRFQGEKGGFLSGLLHSETFALQHLLHALMKYYIEAESTGTHNQFYDKFNIRYEIFQVMRDIWPNKVYRNNLETESKVNPDFFVRFVNLTLNDVTFLLDESLGAFRQIHTLQNELKEPYVAALDAEEKKKKEELLEDNQKKAKSWMQLTNETISMLRLFTEALADAFSSQEIVQRLADMLDYNLSSMAGDKQRDLKVENPAQYGFKPLELLSDLVSVYLNLSSKQSFVTAVAKDLRSYNYNIFKHAADILARSSTVLKDPVELAAFRKFLDDVENTKEAMELEEEWLGDVPDEFLDPLLATIMEDPVILPISKNVVDRGTIRSHLLSDPHDPFNRTPLKIEDVIPDLELKARIDKYRDEAREKAKKSIEEKKAKEAEAAVETAQRAESTEATAAVEPMEGVESSQLESAEAASGQGKRKANDEGGRMDTTE